MRYNDPALDPVLQHLIFGGSWYVDVFLIAHGPDLSHHLLDVGYRSNVELKMIGMYHRQLTGEGDGRRDLGTQTNGTCKCLHQQTQSESGGESSNGS